MNVLLWILQIALAFTYFAGGSYKLSKSDVLTSQVPAMPRGGWRILGVWPAVMGVLVAFVAFGRYVLVPVI